tara:strand:+ start:750 stop:2270 length:1521 start_codon:yes stop_codon:yes gene_type:complete
MPIGYASRNDTSNNIASGQVLNAADLDGEFDAILVAFNSTTGHTHDGVSSGQGGPVSKVGETVGGDLEVISSGIFPMVTATLDIGKPTATFNNIYIGDNKYLYIGADSDYKLGYSSSDTAFCIEAANAQPIDIRLKADRGDNNGDTWIIETLDNGSGGDFVLKNNISGSFVDMFKIDPHSTATSIETTVTGSLVTTHDMTLKNDGAVLGFGADTDTTLTHTDGTGLTLNGTNKLTFGDAASFIHQSSDGTLTIDGESIIDLNASTSVNVSNNLILDSDGAILKFGASHEVTLTHVHNDGLLLNSDMQLQFRDADINIRSDADGDLDINANDEIELNSTLVDINANIDVSGTSLFAGVTTHSAGIQIADGATIGSVSDTDAMTISAAGLVTFSKPVVPATQTSAFSSLSSGVLNFDNFQNFVITLGAGGNTFGAPTTEAGNIGQTGTIILVQPSGGTAGTVTMHGDYKTIGNASLSLSSGLSKVDLVPYIIQSDNNILLGNTQLDFS